MEPNLNTISTSTNILTASELEELPVLPNDNSDFTEGTYTIPCHKKKELTAEGPDIVHKIWFHTQPLDTDTIQRIPCMKLVAKSRDQGFIDDPLAGNWTWFEIAILKTKYSEEPRVKDGIHLVWVSHRNRFLSKDYGWEEGVKFGKDHDIFRLLEEGNVIAVRLCARFQAWQIKARTGYLVLDIGAPVNTTILPNSVQISSPPSNLLFRAEMLTSAGEKPLLVLSLDGGGVRGVAALMHLDAIMKKVAPGKKPCEVFDMIGGTSTGGFIAIMLGRLLVKSGSKWDASELDKCIKQLVQEQLGQDPGQVLLLDEESAKTCKVFVMATRQEGANNQAPVLFRSYENPLEKSELSGIKLWEAARATSAAPMYFAPLEVGGYKFLNGGLQANNPMGWLWNEVLSVFSPARSTNCFLSIGTGIAATKAVGDVRNLKGFTEPVAMLATNSKITKLVFRSLINAFAPKPMAKKYCRFNLLETRVEGGVAEMDDITATDATEDQAKKYVALAGAQKMIEEFAEVLREDI
ncbi:hypothetical protein LZL87_010004 [Fusarium oxysporum]|nr:hypothetical protein LZL87_010004 [Fusarium oxysporum]